jgi:hypothetical protein
MASSCNLATRSSEFVIEVETAVIALFLLSFSSYEDLKSFLYSSSSSSSNIEATATLAGSFDF